jgi:copper chaperone
MSESTSNSHATFTVTGMTCDGCVRHVRHAIESIDGVTDVDVQLAGGLVTVTSDAPLDPAAVQAAVVDAGYEVADR